MKITTALFLLLLCASCNEKKTDVVDDNEEMTETKMPKPYPLLTPELGPD